MIVRVMMVVFCVIMAAIMVNCMRWLFPDTYLHTGMIAVMGWLMYKSATS